MAIFLIAVLSLAACSRERQFADASPKSNGGQGGGQVGELDASFTILSSVPADEETDVDRSAGIEVQFSSEIDAETVASDTFTVLGPSGPVAGEFRIDGNTVSFEPTPLLAVYARYSVTLSRALRAAAGPNLDEAYEMTFRTADGSFTEPTRISTDMATSLEFAGNNAGDAILAWSTDTTPRDIRAASFDGEERTWTAAQSLENSDTEFRNPCVALGSDGTGFVVYEGPLNSEVVGGWNSFGDSKWGVKQDALDVSASRCAVTDGGARLVAWWDDGDGVASRIDTAWSEPVTIEPGGNLWHLVPLGDGALATFKKAGEDQLFASRYDSDQGWLSSDGVTGSSSDPNFIALKPDGDRALLVWLEQTDGTVRASIFEDGAWSSPAELGPASEWTAGDLGGDRAVAVWEDDETVFASARDGADSWTQAQQLGRNDEVVALQVSVDQSGNALAAWPQAGKILVYRLRANEVTWEGLPAIESEAYEGAHTTVSQGGELLMVWRNATGIWSAEFK